MICPAIVSLSLSLLAKAVELAASRTQWGLEMMKLTEGKTWFLDEAYMAADYFQVLKHLAEEGRLPADREAEYEAQKERLRREQMEQQR